MLTIDGSQKSGSGTIVRTALAIAAILQQPLRIENIRARRDPQGLRRQHVQAAEAVCEMTGGSLQGAEVHSSDLEFEPQQAPRFGSYAWDVGSAGSTTMIASTVLPLALFAGQPSVFQITGGIFQDFAPTGYFLQYALLPVLGRMGVRAEMEIVRPGYVPRGGGILRLRAEALASELQPIELLQRGRHFEVWGLALSSHLDSQEVSDRMAQSCTETLKLKGVTPYFRIIYDHTAYQRGAALAVFFEDEEGCTLGADMAGAPGRRSEKIGKRVAKRLLRDLEMAATVDEHLADQLILYAALAKGTTRYRIPRKSDHIESSLWLVSELLGVSYSLEEGLLSIQGIGFKGRV